MADASTRVSPDMHFPEVEDRLYLATRAWLVWLQGLFATRPQGHYRWSPDADATEIIITDQEALSAVVTSKRPRIVTARGPASYAGVSHSQMEMTPFAGHDMIVSDLITCYLTLSFVAREGVEAQSLAYTVFRLVPLFRASLCRMGRMHAIHHRNMSLGPEQPYNAVIAGSSSPEWKLVQVTVPFSVQDTVTTDGGRQHALFRRVEDKMLELGTDIYGKPV